MKNIQYKIADIRFIEGILQIDTTAFSIYHKHYDVDITIDDNLITVTAQKPVTAASISKGSFFPDLITEDSCHMYKPWPWSKPRLRSNNLVEFKVRTDKKYTSTTWSIIEHK